MPLNHQVVYHLQEVVGLLPQLGGDQEIGKAFRVESNDSGMVVYVSALIRTVLALHELSKSAYPLWSSCFSGEACWQVNNACLFVTKMLVRAADMP